MKKIWLTFLLLFIFCFNNLIFSNSPYEKIWGVYASGVGERLRPGMDPCWVTYTVGLVSDTKIQSNVEKGLMGALLTNVNWFEASAAQRSYSRYFDDKPDGIYKLTPCEVRYPNLSGDWVCTQNCPAGGEGKRAKIIQNGLKLTITNEGGNTTEGKFENANTILAFDWGNLKAGINNDGKEINWSNGTIWVRP